MRQIPFVESNLDTLSGQQQIATLAATKSGVWVPVLVPSVLKGGASMKRHDRKTRAYRVSGSPSSIF
jgi:hypothetical protein